MILNVGCGLNLSNEEPTLSVNQLVTGLGAPSVSREEYLAHLFNALHSLITSFNAGQKQHVFEEIMIMEKNSVYVWRRAYHFAFKLFLLLFFDDEN